MNQVFIKIVERGTPPTRVDLAKLLASLGKPGENQEDKAAAVTALYEQSGHVAHNTQGIHVTEILDSFTEF